MIFVLTIVGLLIYGLGILFSSSWYIASNIHQNAYFFLIKQSIWTALGLFLMFILSKIDYKKWKKVAIWLLGVAVISLIAVQFVGIPVSGTRRWFRIGVIGFQTGELAKFAFMLFLATYFSNLSEEKKNFLKTFLYPFGIFVVLIGLLTLQPDLTAVAGLTFVTIFVFYFVGVKKRYILIFISVLILYITILFIQRPYYLKRIYAVLNPSSDSHTSAYQLMQSLIAIGSNGLFGAGFNNSLQKYFYLPGCYTDTIFSILAEELGIIGVVVLFIMYLLLIYQIIRVAKNTELFGKLLCSGFVISIFIPVFTHIASTTGLIPFVSAVLPFVSYSGTSIVFILMSLGIILNISKSSDGMSCEKTNRANRELNLLFLTILLCFIILLVRVIYIQTIKKPILVSSAVKMHFIVTKRSFPPDKEVILQSKEVENLAKGKTERQFYKTVKKNNNYKILVRDSRGNIITK